MLAEFSLGRAGHSDAVGSFKNIGASRGWWGVGILAILASYMILCYYMVVAGWTFEYFWESVTGGLFEVSSAGDSLHNHYSLKMNEYVTDSVKPLVYTYVMIVINILVLIAGVQKGIELLSNWSMPLLFLILVVFVVVSLTLPGASQGLEYFLSPDFSKITPRVVINALGQTFFSLSLGMGILITYAAYYPKNINLRNTSVTVSMLALLVAVMMGLIIFPSVTSFGLTDEGFRGGTLIFVTLPQVFSQMPATQLWSILFFLLLTIAALTSTISIAEVAVAFICDRFKVCRWKSCLIVLLPLFVFSSICSLSMGQWSHITIGGLNIFDAMDYMATNIMLPVGAILLCIFVGWFAPRGMFIGELSNQGSLQSRLYAPVVFIVKYIAPLLIALVLVSSFI